MKSEPDYIPPGYTRVTDVFKPYTGYDKIDKTVLDRAADRGTRAHTFCTMHALNLLVVDPDDDCKGYVQSFANWFDNAVEKVLYTEQRLNSPTYKLSGKFDFIVLLKGDVVPTIMDIKTPADFRREWQLQTAAYQLLAKECMSLDVPRRMSVKVAKDGSRAIVKEYTEHERDQELYLAALSMYRFFGLQNENG